MVGHTHDLVDAYFALISQALRNKDCLSLTELRELMRQFMTRPPLWGHLQDQYNFRDVRPSKLTAGALPGIGVPHHIRLRWDRGRNIVLSTKRWMSDVEFSAEEVLVPESELEDLLSIASEINVIQPVWPNSFQGEALTFLDSLGRVVEA